MRLVKTLALVIVAWGLSSSAASADVQLRIQDGRVSLVAKDATLRQILTEWARVGQTKIINVDRIPGGPQTLQLTDLPEQQALQILLRTVSGYMLAPRPVPDSALSQFDRIIVMPTSVAPRAPAAQPMPSVAVFQPPQPPAENEEEERAPNVQAPNPGRGPIFSPFPQPQPLNQDPQGATGGEPATGATGAPTFPFQGVSTPGMVVPAPPQRGQQPGVIEPPSRN